MSSLGVSLADPQVRVFCVFHVPRSFLRAGPGQIAGMSGTGEVREDVHASPSLGRAIRQKHGRTVPPDKELAAELIADERVLLAIPGAAGVLAPPWEMS